MRRPPDPVGEFEELRGLLLSRETQELRDLRARLADREQRSRDIAAVLPEAVKLSRERGEELTRALRPTIENSIRESIERKPKTFVEALHPIIGALVRRSMAESSRRSVQSLNRALEHTFSWKGLKWRFEAMRRGRSFSEVVLEHSLVYRVEQVFLIHRQTGKSLLQVAAAPTITSGAEEASGMLSAIQDFARDSFDIGEESSLEEFRLGDLQVWIAPGAYAYLAAVIRGEPPRELRTVLENTIESIHTLNGSALARFNGNTAIFEPLRPDLESCLRSQSDVARSGRGRHARAWLALFLLALILGAGLAFWARGEMHWRNFTTDLNRQPGIIVTSAHRGWFSDSEIDGLRDSSSPDPVALARAAQLDPQRLHFHWRNYLALDDANVRERFEQHFGIPPNAHVEIQDGVVTLTGALPFEWLEAVRNESTLVPGVKQVIDRDAQVAYDPSVVLKRFETKFSLPENVSASIDKNVLVLSGEASHRWIERVRAGANEIAGITSVNDRDLLDLDAQAFQQTKSVIENAFVYFVLNRDEIATEGFAALSRLPDEIRHSQNAAKRLGLNFSLEIDGYAEAVAERAKNFELSQRRANKVRDFLLTCGLDENLLKPIGKGAPLKTTLGSMLSSEQSDRRVGFKMMAEPIVPSAK